MTALYYYYYSAMLTEDEIIEIDEKIYRELVLNTKRKTKEMILVVSVAAAVFFGDRKPAQAIGLNPPATYTSGASLAKL